MLFTAYAIVRTVPSANRPNRRKKNPLPCFTDLQSQSRLYLLNSTPSTLLRNPSVSVFGFHSLEVCHSACWVALLGTWGASRSFKISFKGASRLGPAREGCFKGAASRLQGEAGFNGACFKQCRVCGVFCGCLKISLNIIIG